jgi:hypothetical protein
VLFHRFDLLDEVLGEQLPRGPRSPIDHTSGRDRLWTGEN